MSTCHYHQGLYDPSSLTLIQSTLTASCSFLLEFILENMRRNLLLQRFLNREKLLNPIQHYQLDYHWPLHRVLWPSYCPYNAWKLPLSSFVSAPWRRSQLDDVPDGATAEWGVARLMVLGCVFFFSYTWTPLGGVCLMWAVRGNLALSGAK